MSGEIDETSRLLGQILAKQESTDSHLATIEQELGKRPCMRHEAEIAKLQVKASIFGALGGVLTSVGIWLVRKG